MAIKKEKNKMTFKQFFKYMFKTPLQTKLNHLSEYFALNRDLNIAQRDCTDSFRLINRSGLDAKPDCKVCFYVMYENEQERQHWTTNYTKIVRCPFLNGADKCTCDKPCLFQAENKKYNDAQERIQALSTQMDEFWTNKAQQVK